MASPPSRKFTRLARLGGLAGRVSSSYVGAKLKSVARDPEVRARALERLHLDNAERVVATIGNLKGTAMKLGQSAALLSTVLDLPPEVQSVLGRLHDDVEPIATDVVRAQIAAELGAPVEQLFADFDPSPLGTASLGQAHAATLSDGREVVIKVLHPGIDASVDSDLAAMRALLVGSRLIRRPRSEMDAMWAEVRERLNEELDYLQEAANIVAFGGFLGADPRYRLPGVHPALSSERVLTMDRLRGVSLDAFAAGASLEQRRRVAHALTELPLVQAFRHRTLHADPHPGNFLFAPDGTIGVLDFGCVKRFDEHWIANYARAALAAIDRDRPATLAAAEAVGVWRGGPKEAEDVLWEFCEAIVEPFRRPNFRLGPESDAFMARMNRLSAKMLRYPEPIQGSRHLIYLHRSFGGILTMGRALDVELDFGAIARPHLQYAVDYADGLLP